MKMIELTSTDKNYLLVEELLQSAFPREERRDLEKQRQFTDNNEKFHCNAIYSENEYVGLITYWYFTDYIYIEHFAISESLRGKGFGQKALATIKETINKPIILEVEMPVNKHGNTDPIAMKRIKFYQQSGFELHEMEYEQPPYHPNDEWLPMKLMTFGDINMKDNYPTIKQTIYREVYEVESTTSFIA